MTQSDLIDIELSKIRLRQLQRQVDSLYLCHQLVSGGGCLGRSGIIMRCQLVIGTWSTGALCLSGSKCDFISVLASKMCHQLSWGWKLKWKRSYYFLASGFYFIVGNLLFLPNSVTIARSLYFIFFVYLLSHGCVNINVFVINILGEIFIYNISLFNFLSSELLTTREGVVH